MRSHRGIPAPNTRNNSADPAHAMPDTAPGASAMPRGSDAPPSSGTANATKSLQTSKPSEQTASHNVATTPDVSSTTDTDTRGFGQGDLGTPELYLRYSFRNPSLLRTALTHSSRAHEHQDNVRDPSLDNEQLEFLGDSVLNLLAAQALIEEFPSAEEGNLTRLRSSIVSRDSLAPVARRLQLGRYILLGRGEDRSGGRRKPAILADALEAVIAALYLDGGLAVASEFVRREIVTPALPALREAVALRAAVGDHKTALQELLQSVGYAPRYLPIEESGPDHQRSFRIAVAILQADGSHRTLAEAVGSTKKQAQQRAAALALELLQAEGLPQPAPAATA